jgi:predicted RNA-binding Zn-ribbon protein involved in translation (DUF1610 family)
MIKYFVKSKEEDLYSESTESKYKNFLYWKVYHYDFNDFNGCNYLHRFDAPAIESSCGRIDYYLYGEKSNLNGPAMIEGNYKEYWIAGLRSNKSGPAIEYEDGRKEYWYRGEKINLSTNEECMKEIERLVEDRKKSRTKNCTTCNSVIIRNNKFDAYYCKNCNEWKEKKCMDSSCKFCSVRPEKPL